MANFVEKNSSDDYSDINELIIEDEQNEMFEKCSNFIRNNATNLDSDVLLELYAFYKQGTEGHCNMTKPYFFDMKNKAKWEAWKRLGDMSPTDAKLSYIELVRKIRPDFEQENTEQIGNSWMHVSTMLPTVEKNNYDSARGNICDLIRNGILSKILQYLEGNSERKNTLDANGMGLMHYAADIGNLEVLQLLIKQGLNIDLTDVDGQTALHYAASCGHYECVRFLCENNARTDIQDSDQCTAIDVAADDQIKKLLSSN